jgi:CubicO group peptidase (beta-lactamase class C family)
MVGSEVGFQRSSPESLGVPSHAVLHFLDRLAGDGQEHHAFTLLRHGATVFEGAWAPYQLEDEHRMFSVSKSVTSLAIGFLLQEGRLSLDDLAVDLLPESASACRDPLLETLTVRQILMMTTGQDVDPIFTLGEDGRTWAEGFFRTDCVEAPGRTFRYNSTATYVLSAIVQKLSGQRLTDYLQERLFGPLGFGPVDSDQSPEGICAGGWGLFLRVGEAARIGQLLLRKGAHEGRRLLSEEYLDAATSWKVDTSFFFNPVQPGYGYQFWMCPDRAYRAEGAFGQLIVVMPERDAVLAGTNGLHDVPRLLDAIWELRAKMSDLPVPEDPEARAELAARLDGLRYAIGEGSPASAMEPLVSGRRYRLSKNGFGFDSLRVSFAPSGCTMVLESVRGTFQASAGRDGEYSPTRDGWQAVLLPSLSFGARPSSTYRLPRVFAAARWLDEERFRFSLRYSDSPTREDWTLTFREGGRCCTVVHAPSAVMEFAARPPMEGVREE